MDNVFLYQQKVEPLEPIAPAAPDWWVHVVEVPDDLDPFVVPGRSFYPEFNLGPEIVLTDKWFRPTETPPDDVEPVEPGLWTGVTEPTLMGLPVDLDSWFKETETPIFPTPPYPEGGAAEPSWSAIVAPEVITVDKWFKETETPPDDVEPVEPGLWAGVTETTLMGLPVDLDSWFRETQVPIFPTPPYPEGGASEPSWSAIVAPEVITVDKWFRVTQTPPDDVEPVEPGLWVGVTEPTLMGLPVDLDSWFKETETPIFPTPLYPEGGASEPSWSAIVAPEDITVDKWFRITQTPPDDDPPVEPGLWVGVTEPTLMGLPVDLDSWFRPAVHPADVAPSPVNEGGSVSPDWATIQVEEVNLDKWWRPTETPPGDVDPVEPGLWVGVTEPTLMGLPVDLDSWFMETQQPLFVFPNADPSIGPLFIVDVASLVPPRAHVAVTDSLRYKVTTSTTGDPHG